MCTATVLVRIYNTRSKGELQYLLTSTTVKKNARDTGTDGVCMLSRGVHLHLY